MSNIWSVDIKKDFFKKIYEETDDIDESGTKVKNHCRFDDLKREKQHKSQDN